MDERAISRRGRRTYVPEGTAARVIHERIDELPPPHVDKVVASSRLSSAFRRALRERDIDPRMARLVLCLYRFRALRPRELAWNLGVSRPTVSRWLDRAETAGLVDKFYDRVCDRRSTEARLTARGRMLRQEVEAILLACDPHETRFGRAYGRRAVPPWDP